MILNSFNETCIDLGFIYKVLPPLHRKQLKAGKLSPPFVHVSVVSIIIIMIDHLYAVFSSQTETKS